MLLRDIRALSKLGTGTNDQYLLFPAEAFVFQDSLFADVDVSVQWALRAQILPPTKALFAGLLEAFVHSLSTGDTLTVVLAGLGHVGWLPQEHPLPPGFARTRPHPHPYFVIQIEASRQLRPTYRMPPDTLEASYALPPDSLDADDLNRLLSHARCTLTLVLNYCFAGRTLAALQLPPTAMVCASDGGSLTLQTDTADFSADFLEALSDPSADTNADATITHAEAFAQAARRHGSFVKRYVDNLVPPGFRRPFQFPIVIGNMTIPGETTQLDCMLPCARLARAHPVCRAGKP
jgi:hypothetical protein